MAFTPTDLSSLIGVYEINPDNCYTDTARTTNASVGDAVASVADLSGNGNHYAQSTAASRPALRETAPSSGIFYLDFDGTDDRLEIASVVFGSTQALTICMGLEIDAVTGTDIIFESSLNFNNSEAFTVYVAGTTLTAGFHDNGGTNGYSLRNYTIATGTPYVLHLVMDMGSSAPNTIPRINGSATGWTDGNISYEGSAPTAAVFADEPIFLGNRGGAASLRFNGKVFSHVVRGAVPSGSDVADLEAWVAEKSGVTL